MNLIQKYFDQVKNGTKTAELRTCGLRALQGAGKSSLILVNNTMMLQIMSPILEKKTLKEALETFSGFKDFLPEAKDFEAALKSYM